MKAPIQPGRTRLLRFLCGLALLCLLAPGHSGMAQTIPADGPSYVVKAGDSLWDIAVRFGVALDELRSVNGLSADTLTIGQKLVIPGLSGLQGLVDTVKVAYGETLLSLSRHYRLAPTTVVRLNHLASPAELYAGLNLVILTDTAVITDTQRLNLSAGQSLLELAVTQGINPWSLMQENQLASPAQALPGDTLLSASRTPGVGYSQGALPPEITKIELKPGNFLQGKAVVIRVSASPDVSVRGSWLGHDLHFFAESPGNMAALQGVHAMAEPGLYPLVITTTLADQSVFPFSQSVIVRAVDYPYDRPLTVDPDTVDPAITRPEDLQWISVVQPFTPQKYWAGIFKLPSSLPADYCLKTNECWSSRFGNRRSYNGGPYTSFHTGLDVVGKKGDKIFAAADGIVVFTGLLTVRGNATMIDHGWGIYTGYMHQSEIMVKVGDRVQAGQLIGLVGNTGRVEGPHLHWEVWVGGVQVDPLDWLKEVYP